MAKQAKSDYDMNCLVAGLEDYDYPDLQSLSSKQLAIFVLATYGGGEPTDNAIPFDHFLRDCEARDKTLLSSLRYAAFGLGSSFYQLYDAMIRRLDQVMTTCGATRVGMLGFGDDGKGTLDDDFTQWSESSLLQIAGILGMRQVQRQYLHSFEVQESPTDVVFQGEPNKAHLYRRVRRPFTPDNPFPAATNTVKELFMATDRKCVHVEFDTEGSTVACVTGDHVAVWRTNSDLEVELFLRVFGLKGAAVISITAKDLTDKVPIQSPTTYATAVRHYLDICAPVSRKTLADLASFSPYGPITERLRRLSNDKDLFHDEITGRRLNLARALSMLSQDTLFDGWRRGQVEVLQRTLARSAANASLY